MTAEEMAELQVRLKNSLKIQVKNVIALMWQFYGQSKSFDLLKALQDTFVEQ